MVSAFTPPVLMENVNNEDDYPEVTNQSLKEDPSSESLKNGAIARRSQQQREPATEDETEDEEVKMNCIGGFAGVEDLDYESDEGSDEESMDEEEDEEKDRYGAQLDSTFMYD
jgi:hypothetical protein